MIMIVNTTIIYKTIVNSDPEIEKFLSNGIKPDETFNNSLIGMEVNKAIKTGLAIMANNKGR